MSVEDEKNVTVIEKKKMNPIIPIVIAVVVILVGIVAYFGVIVPGQTVSSIAKNNSIRNGLLDPYNKITTDIQANFKTINFSDPKAIDDNIQSWKNVSKDIDGFLAKSSTEKGNLDKGNNDDSQNFYQTVEKNIVLMEKTQQSANDYAKYFVCYTEKRNQIVKNITEVQAESEKLTTASTSDEKIKVYSLAADSNKKNAQLITDLNTCFSGNMSKYLTDEVKQQITSSSTISSDLSSGFDAIVTSAKAGDETKTTEAIANIAVLNTKTSDLFSDKTTNDLLTKPLEMVTGASKEFIDNQTGLLSTLDTIKKKYNLN